LMVGGIDRYYQIAKCFRDEDLRADRQPEFTQIDIETSFLNDDEIMDLMEGMTVKLFNDLLGVKFEKFRRMPYSEAMRDYASDKPDLRIPLKLVDVADLMQEVELSSKYLLALQKILKAVLLPYVFQVQHHCHVVQLMNTPNSLASMVQKVWLTSKLMNSLKELKVFNLLS